MNEQILTGLESAAEAEVAASCRAYQVLAGAFEYPDEDFTELIRDGSVAEALRDALRAVDPSLVEGGGWDSLSEAGGEDDLAVEYTRLFDVGASGPPCPLYGGLYGGARMKVMEEAVRFYNHFGLTLSESPRELPDHLITELEFLHYLCFREAEALHSGGDPKPYRRARRDFVARHPSKWVPKLRQRLEQQEPMAFFRELVRLLEEFLAQESKVSVSVDE